MGEDFQKMTVSRMQTAEFKTGNLQWRMNRRLSGAVPGTVQCNSVLYTTNDAGMLKKWKVADFAYAGSATTAGRAYVTHARPPRRGYLHARDAGCRPRRGLRRACGSGVRAGRAARRVVDGGAAVVVRRVANVWRTLHDDESCLILTAIIELYQKSLNFIHFSRTLQPLRYAYVFCAHARPRSPHRLTHFSTPIL